MNVLSLFDGMSCGRIALDRAGIKVDNYYASEIDKYAIEISKKNYPDIIQLGDINKISLETLFRLPKIDLLIGGSPCQGFSFAGKQLNFDDPRSKLFFEFERIMDFLRPKYFLLENVVMSKQSQDVITSYLGVKPVKINSSLVSAQNRNRLYWTNIPFDLPEDKGIVLKDILEPITNEAPVPINERNKRHYRKIDQKGLCCTASMYKGAGNNGMTIVDRCIQVGEANLNGHDILKRVYSDQGKGPTVNSCSGGNREPKVATSNTEWRKLTPLECERLQTIPDNYTSGVSNTQRYKMIGNGWTVDVIAQILRGIK